MVVEDYGTLVCSSSRSCRSVKFMSIMFGWRAHTHTEDAVCWEVSPCMVWSLQHLHPGWRPWRARPPMCIRFARLPFTCSLAWIHSWRRRISDWEERLFRNWQVCGVAQSLLPATFFADISFHISHKYYIVLRIEQLTPSCKMVYLLQCDKLHTFLCKKARVSDCA